MFNFIFSTAFAQTAPAAVPPQPGFFVTIAPFLIILVIFYFLMIRPAQKQRVAEQEMLKKLEKGEEVFTKSGIIGKIVGMTEKVVTLEIDNNVKMKIVRSEIGGKTANLFAEKK